MFDYKGENGTSFSKISKNVIFTVRVHNIFHRCPQSSERPILKKRSILQSDKLSTLKMCHYQSLLPGSLNYYRHTDA